MTRPDSGAGVAATRRRPRIGFFSAPDVFEDFYPHYGVDRRAFATWSGAMGNHAFVDLLQREVGDVIWYELSIDPTVERGRHQVLGCELRFLPSAPLHRWLWETFYRSRHAWRWRRAYPAFAAVSSYAAVASTRLLAALRGDDLDVLFVQDYWNGRFDMLLLAARRLGVPLIAYHSGSTVEEYIGTAIRRWTLPRADALIASSRHEADMLTTRFRVSRDRVRVILTPIDLSTYRPIARRAACESLGLDPDGRYVLFMGRFDPVKRLGAVVDAFLRTASQRPEGVLLLAGDGPQQPRLRRRVAEAGSDRVRFLGWISDPEQKALLYNAAECVVLASWREGFPTVVGEAMACGTPVLSSRVGGVGELVDDGRTGWLFNAGDDDALTEKLNWVLNHHDDAHAMRPAVVRAARERVAPSSVAGALRECFAAAGCGTAIS